MTPRKAAVKAPPTPDLESAAELRLYTPEEVVAEFHLPTTPRMLRERCHKREIEFTKYAGRIRFRLPHIRALMAQHDVPVLDVADRQAAAS